MGEKIDNISVTFFESQFQRQVQEKEFSLNPFEKLALDYLKGDILDLGSGLGNLSLEAGRNGHCVFAVEASPTAVARIISAAQAESLPVRALRADISEWKIDKAYDTIICIGLLMFFPRGTALEILRDIQENIKPGGIAIVNTLIEGTTYMSMFDPDNYCLFPKGGLEEEFRGWRILLSSDQSFPAPGNSVKMFTTVIAEKPDK